MSPIRTACKPEWISQFIHEDLEDGQLLQLEQHLSVCELCQSSFNEQLSSLEVQRSLDHLRTEAEQHATTHRDTTQQVLLTNFATVLSRT